MARPKKEETFPRDVTFEGARVRISKRSNGMFSLAWRESGSWRKTTKATETAALSWAATKARKLAGATGEQWIREGAAEALAKLRTIAGPEEGAVRRLLEDVADALKWLEGRASLREAAQHFAEKGPLKVQRLTLADSVERFVAEYRASQPQTAKTFGNELEGYVATRPEAMLLDVTQEGLTTWCHRQVAGPNGKRKKAEPRTIRNRITTWITFLNRCRDWGLLPALGKHAAEAIRRPKIPDAGKEIFTVEQGGQLLRAAIEEEARCLPFLIVAGWLGLRPSEAQRLTWEAVEWDRGYLHLSPKVAGKTAQERYVPMDPRVTDALRWIYERVPPARRKGRMCVFRSREFLSVLARRRGIVETWPDDVLRHSFCSYRLAVIQDLAKVAEEAGNSPGILRKHYRRPMRAEDGAAWWMLLDGFPCAWKDKSPPGDEA